MKFYLLLWYILSLNLFRQCYAREVTHQDIRDAMVNFIHLIKDSSDKLERHELRERDLGAQLKRALSGLDARERAQDALLRNIGTTLSSIDKRLKKLEANQNQEEAAKGAYTIDTVPLQSWMSQVETLLQKQTKTDEPAVNKLMLEGIEASVNFKIDYLTSVVEKLQADVLKTAGHIASLTARERTQANLDTQLALQQSWQDNVLNKLDRHSTLLYDIQNGPKLSAGENSTMEELHSIKNELASFIKADSDKSENILKEIIFTVNDNQRKIQNHFKDSQESIEGILQTLLEKFRDISKDIMVVGDMEKILVQTSDNVMETRRKIEYGIHQIVSELAEHVKTQGFDLNNNFNSKFSGIADAILEYQTGTIGNLSAKVENEIAQVWRQIGIMYQQIISSAGILEKLQNQTDTYITDERNNMDIVSSKIEDIRSDLASLKDDNNYAIGRISLFAHEFNETRSALAEASKFLKIADKENEEKPPKVGPGPHSLESNSAVDDNVL